MENLGGVAKVTCSRSAGTLNLQKLLAFLSSGLAIHIDYLVTRDKPSAQLRIPPPLPTKLAIGIILVKSRIEPKLATLAALYPR